MRLTLRTLLAWLDDKLPPAEVREIGKQVSESPYAKDLVDRIHKVTRQRRLSVPSSNGPDATDPNLVASYIDNELAPELVAEFEKKCLTSDVHLAEVSSVHQILSLIGQKAKVPNEARLRMYQLVKGREALRPTTGAHSAPEELEPVAQPIQPWVTPPAPARPAYQRFAPLAAVIGLMAVLSWAAWSTLSTQEDVPTFRNLQLAANKPQPKEKANAESAGPTVAEPAVKDPVQPAAAPAEVTEKKTEPEAAKKDEPGAAIPAGAVAFARKPTGVLLRYQPDRREWVRLTDAAGLKEQDRLLGLEPYRSVLEVGSANVDVVSETEVWMKATPKTLAGKLALTRGRIVLHGNPSGQPFEVQSGDLTLTVTPPAGVAVGVERLSKRAPGEPKAAPGLVVVHASEGSVSVGTGKDTVTLDAAGSVTVGDDGKVVEKSNKPVPSWVTETAPAPFDQKIGETFAQFFRADRPIVSSLVDATEDEQKDTCRLAITALKGVGDISFIVPLLNRKGGASAATARRTAISVLRAFLAESPESAAQLSDQLKRDLGDDLAKTVEKLLVGYTPAEAKEEATYEQLVRYLGTTDDGEIGLRELALDNLRQLTGRDELEYDPEKPEGPGLKAWRDLLRDNALKPQPPKTGSK